MRIRRELLRLLRETAMLDGRHFSMLALICNTSDSRAWNLLHGPIEQFNSETLIDVLARLGVTISVVVVGPRRQIRYFAGE